MATSLLFIEDNEDILLNLYGWFDNEKYVCDCARSGLAGLNMALEGWYDCIILDLMLPELGGMSLCEKLRESGDAVPVIMLTAKDSIEDKIAGLECGADDYLVKPFSLKELEARIKAVVRRGKTRESAIRTGGITLNRREHRAFRAGVELKLSPATFKILDALVSSFPGIARKESLEQLLWADNPPEGSALRNHIHELRKVLDKPFDKPCLETIPHVGWRLKFK